MAYVSSATDQHEYDEEYDWVKILTSAPETAGMLLVVVQKLCTAFHEYGPLARAGIVDSSSWEFIRERLSNRISKVIQVAEDNNFGSLTGIEELRSLLDNVKNIAEMPDLFELAEETHQINHHICDELIN
jgi:hypothetical protein